jgi:hypothetical protein
LGLPALFSFFFEQNCSGQKNKIRRDEVMAHLSSFYGTAYAVRDI